MAYLQARSGIARSGVTYCGWTPPRVVAYLAGVDRTSSLLTEGWSLTGRADGSPPMFRFRTRTITPVVGADVTVLYATPNDYLFGGTLLTREIVPDAPNTGALTWDCTAVGYQWLLSCRGRVLEEFLATGVSTMVGYILFRYTKDGFRVGYCPSSLGNLDMTFTYDTVWDALRRIATAVGARIEITPDKAVNIFVDGDYPEAALTTVTGATAQQGTFRYREDLSQVRTVTIHEGRTTTALATSAGATEVGLQDVTPFESGGGSARVGVDVFNYTGILRVTGTAGYLTGCSGVFHDIPAGATVSLYVIASDAAAITALLAILGTSGEAYNYLQDGRLSADEAAGRAQADLDTFGGALQEVQYVAKTANRRVRAGRRITLNVTTPISVAGTYPIQAVTLKPYGKVTGTNFNVEQQVELGVFTRSLNDLLRQTRG